MRKFASFALVICLLVIAVSAVLLVTYPSAQEPAREFFLEAGARISEFFKALAEPFRRMFAL